MDIINAAQKVDTVIKRFQEYRMNVDTYHGIWWDAIVKLAEQIGVEEPRRPRTCSRQLHRQNTPSTTWSEHIKRTLTIPMLGTYCFYGLDLLCTPNHLLIVNKYILDMLVAEMQARFAQEMPNKLLLLLPETAVEAEQDDTWHRSALQACGSYFNDMPDPSTLRSELTTWFNHW